VMSFSVGRPFFGQSLYVPTWTNPKARMSKIAFLHARAQNECPID
jgi:hypothetical protein